MALVLGSVMHGYLWEGLIGFVVVVLVALTAWAIVESISLGPTPSTQAVQQQSAEVVLAERLARGEIDPDEYRRCLEALKGEPVTS